MDILLSKIMKKTGLSHCNHKDILQISLWYYQYTTRSSIPLLVVALPPLATLFIGYDNSVYFQAYHNGQDMHLFVKFRKGYITGVLALLSAVLGDMVVQATASKNAKHIHLFISTFFYSRATDLDRCPNFRTQLNLHNWAIQDLNL